MRSGETESPKWKGSGWSEYYDDLVTINLTTGAATVVGEYGYGTCCSALDMAPDGKLYYFGAGIGDGEGIVRLDPATGLRIGAPVPLVGNDNFRWNAGSHDAAGTLYALRFGGEDEATTRYLVTLDTATGVFTTIGEIPLESPSGLAWSIQLVQPVPTFSTWGTLAFACFSEALPFCDQRSSPRGWVLPGRTFKAASSPGVHGAASRRRGRDEGREHLALLLGLPPALARQAGSRRPSTR